MSFNIPTLVNEIKEKAKKAQQKQILDAIMKSSNQPEFPDTEDMDELVSFIESLPEEHKYSAKFDPLLADMFTGPDSDMLTLFNVKGRANQVTTVESAKNTELKGVIKSLAEDLPELIMKHVAANIADHITIAMAEVQGHTHTITKTSVPIV